MNKATEEAIRKSIEKWERIMYEGGEDDGSANCELCRRFSHSCWRKNKRAKNIEHCPAAIKVGNNGCQDTPYFEWTTHHEEDHGNDTHPFSTECKACDVFARKELDFLKSLLPFKKVKVKRKKVTVNVYHEKEPFDLVIKFIDEKGEE